MPYVAGLGVKVTVCSRGLRALPEPLKQIARDLFAQLLECVVLRISRLCRALLLAKNNGEMQIPHSAAQHLRCVSTSTRNPASRRFIADPDQLWTVRGTGGGHIPSHHYFQCIHRSVLP